MTLQLLCDLKYFKAVFYFFPLYQIAIWQILLIMALQNWTPALKSWEIKTSCSYTCSSWSLSLILVKKGHRILPFKGWQLSNFILCGCNLANSQPHTMPNPCLFQALLQSSFLPALFLCSLGIVSLGTIDLYYYWTELRILYPWDPIVILSKQIYSCHI